MAWFYLFVAGGLEVVATTVFRYTDGLSRIVPTVSFFVDRHFELLLPQSLASRCAARNRLCRVDRDRCRWHSAARPRPLQRGCGPCARPAARRAHRLHRRPQVRLRPLGPPIDDPLLPARDRLRARPLHRRPERRQARRRHRAAQPLAPPAAPGRSEGGGAAEEHPDDRADGRRQDRDLAAPRQARGRAVHQGRGDEVHRGRLRRPRCRFASSATWSRWRWPSSRRRKRKDVRAKAEKNAEERVLDALVGANLLTRQRARPSASGCARGELNDKEIEIQVAETTSGLPMFDIPGAPGASIGAINIGDMLGKAFGQRTKAAPRHRLRQLRRADRGGERQADRHRAARRRGDQRRRRTTASCSSTRSTRSARARTAPASAADVSREGVQRDLLPLIEGTTVSTKYGPVKTDHVLFIASGAFHVAKPSDLLAGAAGAAADPRRAQAADARGFAPHPHRAGGEPHQAVRGADGDRADSRSPSTDDAIDALADAAVQVNSTVENIGARRLQTVMERVLDEISFDASDRGGRGASSSTPPT